MRTPNPRQVDPGADSNPGSRPHPAALNTGIPPLLTHVSEEVLLGQPIASACEAVLSATHALCYSTARLSPPPPTSGEKPLCPAADTGDVLATYSSIADAIRALMLVTEALELRLRALGVHPGSGASDEVSQTATARLVEAAECGLIRTRLSEALLPCQSLAQSTCEPAKGGH